MLDVQPSKRLILFYSLLYGLTLVSLVIYSHSWPWLIAAITIASLLAAAILHLYTLWDLKTLICLPKGRIDLQFKKQIKRYDHITVCHQGPKLIILQCKNANEQRYVLCFFDAFIADDFASLQRHIQG